LVGRGWRLFGRRRSEGLGGRGNAGFGCAEHFVYFLGAISELFDYATE
jgi:hypothetical protein